MIYKDCIFPSLNNFSAFRNTGYKPEEMEEIGHTRPGTRHHTRWEEPQWRSGQFRIQASPGSPFPAEIDSDEEWNSGQVDPQLEVSEFNYPISQSSRRNVLDINVLNVGKSLVSNVKDEILSEPVPLHFKTVVSNIFQESLKKVEIEVESHTKNPLGTLEIYCLNRTIEIDKSKNTIYSEKKRYRSLNTHYGLKKIKLGDVQAINSTLLIFEQFTQSDYFYRWADYFEDIVDCQSNISSNNYSKIEDLYSMSVIHMPDNNSNMTVYSEIELCTYMNPYCNQKIQIRSRFGNCSAYLPGISFGIRTYWGQDLVDFVLYKDTPSVRDAFILVNYIQTKLPGENTDVFMGNHPKCRIRRIQSPELNKFCESGMRQNYLFRRIEFPGQALGKVYINTDGYEQIEGILKTSEVGDGWDIRPSLNCCSLSGKTLIMDDIHQNQNSNENCDSEERNVHVLPGTPLERFMQDELQIEAVCVIGIPKTLALSFHAKFLITASPEDRNYKFEHQILTYKKIKDCNYSSEYFLNRYDKASDSRILISFKKDYLLNPSYSIINHRLFCGVEICPCSKQKIIKLSRPRH